MKMHIQTIYTMEYINKKINERDKKNKRSN